MKGNGRTNDSLTCEHELLTPKRVARELAVSEAWVRDHTSGRRHPTSPTSAWATAAVSSASGVPI
jgi:hypothetical protein